MRYEDFIIAYDATIQNAIDKMNDNGKGIIYIVKNDCLFAVLTDGDLRRSLLKDSNISRNVSCIANQKPICLAYDNDQNIFEMMDKHHINSLPIVNENGHIRGIAFNDGSHFFPHAKLEIPVVIMAGGKGTRLYPYTKILPKPLIPIGEKTITELILDHFRTFGCNDVKMIVNYKKDFIISYLQCCQTIGSIEFIKEDKFCGTGGGLCLLKDKIDQTFFMTNCDIIVEEDYANILKYHQEHKCIITIVSVDKKIMIPYGTIQIDNYGYVSQLEEKPEFKVLTNTGMYLIEPEFLQQIPENTFIHITDVIEKCIKKGLHVGVYKVRDDAWLDMGQMKELERMRERKYLTEKIEE